MNYFALKLIKSALLSSPKTRQQLLEITKLPERTLRYNLAILKKQGLVLESPIFSDLRMKTFSLNKTKGGEKNE